MFTLLISGQLDLWLAAALHHFEHTWGWLKVALQLWDLTVTHHQMMKLLQFHPRSLVLNLGQSQELWVLFCACIDVFQMLKFWLLFFFSFSLEDWLNNINICVKFIYLFSHISDSSIHFSGCKLWYISSCHSQLSPRKQGLDGSKNWFYQ